jgi:hypothetical protein
LKQKTELLKFLAMANKQGKPESGTKPSDQTAEQQKTDPQITELKGYVDPNEKLEPMADQIDQENDREEQPRSE